MNNPVVIKCCDTCSRTFYCKYPKEEVCESWSPDMYTEAEIVNGVEVVTWEEYQERMRKKSEQELCDAG